MTIKTIAITIAAKNIKSGFVQDLAILDAIKRNGLTDADFATIESEIKICQAEEK